MLKSKLLMTSAAAILAAAPVLAQTATTTTEATANAETAVAGTTAMAATELNLRAGPGPDMEIIDVIPADGEVTVEGCLESANWCQVTLNGTTGWAYGDYLTVQQAEAAEPVILYDNRTELEVATVTYDNEANDGGAALAGAATAAGTAAALAAGPAGVIGAAVIGAAAGDALNPDQETVTYVRENPVDPVLLQGEVVVGATIPTEVELTPIPDAEYSYLYLNGTPVLVEPEAREVVYIVR
ncbi:DUF1236 domain-containing protein [Limimaricola pyoseonensis]|uniref:SH3 domain-containing protein n=1 Tax=Limimaricola pyoseonensis TaxID=521013 RepID=A0A1G7H0U4_9RHOB|nr:DUF1236 domain-containing protein [Limimaricola pyoseonensis]SDE94062.1 SH3 domain-containing protein [Limimaricola pyoseonensis]